MTLDSLTNHTLDLDYLNGALLVVVCPCEMNLSQTRLIPCGFAATKPDPAMKTSTLLLLCVALTAPLALAQGQSASTASAPQLSPTEQAIKDIKNPTPWLNWGADFRVREEIFENILTLDPNNPLANQNYLRFRGRIWASVTPVDDVSFNVRLANETREWLKPAGYTPYAGQSGLDWRDGIFDTFNVQIRNLFKQPANVTIGRQDIFLGEGWLVGDGTPFDGSWTYFLDSARITYKLEQYNTTIDAIGIIQQSVDDDWLETVNANQHLPLTEQDEAGAILYVSNKSMKSANIDGYFFYKRDELNDTIPFGSKYRPDEADIYTLGVRVSGLVGDHWKYSAEGAYQFGEKTDSSIKYPSESFESRDIRAHGFNGKFSYLIKDRLNNQIGLAYEYLSGDDPDTDDDEMFDNLWGRWPRWSEIGLYSFAAETRIGNEANIHRIGPTWSIDPVKNLNFSMAYYALFAQEEIATRAPSSLIPGDGNFRGHFLQAVLKWKISPHVNAHLWSEFQFPGDYYEYDDTWFFIRPEIMFTF